MPKTVSSLVMRERAENRALNYLKKRRSNKNRQKSQNKLRRLKRCQLRQQPKNLKLQTLIKLRQLALEKRRARMLRNKSQKRKKRSNPFSMRTLAVSRLISSARMVKSARASNSSTIDIYLEVLEDLEFVQIAKFMTTIRLRKVKFS